MVDRLSDSEQLWRLTMEHSPVGMTLVAPDGRLLAANRAFGEMLGYGEHDLARLTFQQITHPDDLAADLAFLEEALAGARTSYRMRKRYLRADGSVMWGDLSVALLRDDAGAPLHFISQVIDVTEQREYEGRLAAASALLDRQRRMTEAIYDTVDVGLTLIDRSGRYETMNRRHREFMALAFPDGHAGTAGQLGAVYAPDGVTPLAREEMPSFRAVHGEEFDDLRMWVGDDPITRRALSVSARTVRDPDGSIAGAALAYKDVTEFMRALDVKDEFVAAVSHELRTPLTSVLGYLELLADRRDLPEGVEEQVRVVERNAVRLRQLVSDLLQVAQEREGGVPLVRTPTDLHVLVDEAVEAVAPAARARDVELVVEEPDEPLVALVDGERLRQVLDNLVSNGVKYTEPGGTVRVRMGRHGRGLEIAVADTGIGIDPADVDRLFTRFFRGRQALDRMAPGTGLGLSIVRAIVEAHGGEVEVESRLGAGSTFRILLPDV